MGRAAPVPGSDTPRDDARGKNPSVPPTVGGAPDAPRGKLPSVPPSVPPAFGGAPNAARGKLPSVPPSIGGPRPSVGAGDALRSKSPSVGPGDALRSKSPSVGPGGALRSKSPSVGPGDALRSKSPSVGPPLRKPIVPVPAARAKTTPDLGHDYDLYRDDDRDDVRDDDRDGGPDDDARDGGPDHDARDEELDFDRAAPAARGPSAARDQATRTQAARDLAAARRTGTNPGIPPAPEPGAARVSRPNMTPVPTRSPTVAHAVPPMPPITGNQAVVPRAETDSDDRLEQAMRETEHLDAVGLDDDDDDNSDDVGAAGATEDDDDAGSDTLSENDDARGAGRRLRGPDGVVKRRSDTDMRTGKSSIGDVTQTGLEAPPPARASIDMSIRAAINVRVPLDVEPAAGGIDDLMKTIEHDPKTPIPTLAHLAASEVAERIAHVPISTAPTSLPPPKQLDAVPSGPTPACPQCEAPMSWVDEHLRFYCRQCRMYF